MNINQTIYEEIKKNNNMITTSQVLSLGYSKQLLTNYVKEGLLERCRQGVYILPNAVHDDMYTIMLRSDRIVFSHDTALFLNGLSERTPFMHTVTIPSNTALPNSLKGECICFYVKPELHDIGIVEKSTTFGNPVRCYNVERTICDFLRCRNRCDEETVISAVKNYAVYDKKNLNRLSVYAKQFKVAKELKQYLEVLL
ncbi:abortive phage infection protein [Clostridium sp. chh4-2]|uniref:type IV toxin-antitoxin system AbiEi family antitoxin domain-containing protein n=1 Tax=Clostridium sp. chh4-2 TaxID=2067550 RepID=UPI000CCE367A|nr:AbiEi antitoxin N-terminal domain-containing protein [Clostridium sp. chh4-2]PNV62952.1 abortive phage infection protein [Clostridium sp. chh4-2]